MKRAILTFLLFFGSIVFGANPAVLLLHRFETTANPLVASNESEVHLYPEIRKLPHVEFPLSWLEKDLAENLDSRVRASLIFKNNNGIEMIRWILAPEDLTRKYVMRNGQIGVSKIDTEYNSSIIEFVKANGGDPALHYYYTGYPSASTTFQIEDPVSKIVFYAKTSNSTPPIGRFSNFKKPRQIWEAKDARLIDDFLVGLNHEKPFKYFTFFQEPASFWIPSLDRSLIIRDAADMKNEKAKFYYVPAFSITDKIVGKEIAEKNGFQNPEEFWTAHAPKILARAFSELFVRTGLKLDSPHGQNYLFEMDENMHLTGRIVFRDLADVTIAEPFYDIFKIKYHLDKSMQQNMKNYSFVKKRGPAEPLFHSNLAAGIFETTRGTPHTSHFDHHPWIKDFPQMSKIWQRLFVDEVDRTIQELTDINIVKDPTDLQRQYPLHKYAVQHQSYLSAEFNIDFARKDWTAYLQKLSAQSLTPSLKCVEIFSAL